MSEPDEYIETETASEVEKPETDTAVVVAPSAAPAEASVPSDVPAEWVAAMRLAGRIHSTPFVPKGMRGDPHAVLACILAGQEMGLGPMKSLDYFDVIEGRPAIKAVAMRALVNRAGHYLAAVDDDDDSRVTMIGKRRDTGATARVTWTMADATRAKLTGNPAWSKYPRQMLLARATSEICRELFADVIGGLYVPEEVAAIEGVAYEPGADELAVLGPNELTTAPPPAPPDPADVADAEWIAQATNTTTTTTTNEETTT